MQILLENVLPYLGVTPIYSTEAEQKGAPVIVPDVRGLEKNEARKILKDFECEFIGVGEKIIDQFPIAGELVNRGERILLRVSEEK
jgi:beta-lactam-binding protein with PASTA domain